METQILFSVAVLEMLLIVRYRDTIIPEHFINKAYLQSA